MYPARAMPNGNLVYVYVSNWHVNVGKYDDFSSDIRLL